MLPSIENSQIIKDTIKQSKENGELNNKYIIIFGCTLYANDIIEALKDNGIKPNGFIDNDAEKVGRLCSGLRVYTPTHLKNISLTELIVIIASPNYSREMYAQLRMLGLLEKNILNIQIRNPNVQEKITKEALENKLECVKEGINKYELLKPENKNGPLFVFPYPGTGDIYVACGYLYAYLEKYQICKPRLVVSKTNCKKVAELFGYDDIVVVSDLDIHNMLLAWQFIGVSKINIKPMLFWGWDTKHYYRMYRNHKELSFSDFFKYDVMGLDEKVEFRHPMRHRNMVYAAEMFSEKNMESGKIIIIAPYAGSFKSSLTSNDWKNIVTLLKNKGYSVCTNCFGKEVPIPGTEAIQFSYEQAVEVLNYAGGFIGIRSGLCDVVSNSNCKMLIIYESNYLASDYEYFSLKKMGLNDHVSETEFETVNKLIEEIEALY